MREVVVTAIRDSVANGAGQFKIVPFTETLLRLNPDLLLDRADYLACLRRELRSLAGDSSHRVKRRATAALQAIDKMSEASLDKIQSLLDNRKEDIDDRHAAQAIERDLFGHMAREVAGGLKVISREQMKAVARLARQEKETATPTENQSIVSPDTGFDENAPEAYEQSGDMDEPGEERGEGDEVLEESEMLFRRAFSEDQMNNHHETITAIPKQPTEATSDARRKLYERIRIKMQASSISMRENAKLLDPMHYKVLDLTGHHIRTKKALGQLYSLARQDYASQILYTRSTLKQHEQDVFDDLDRACTEEQKRIRRMLEICKERLDADTARKPSSELQHCMKNFFHFVDAAEDRGVAGKEQDAQWGDLSLRATSLRKSCCQDPRIRTAMGKRCDFILRSRSISWNPELLIGEISGGLPRCPNWKFWHDLLLKCALGSRDCIWRVLHELPGLTDEELSNVKIYSFQLAGTSLYVYCTDYVHGIFRFAMVDYCTLPVSVYDEEQRKVVYTVLRGVFEQVEQQVKHLILLSRRQRKRRVDDYDPEDAYKALKIVPTPPRNEKEWY